MAGSIDDLALAYWIMAQPDTRDRKSAMFPSPLVKADLSLEKASAKKYIGIYKPWISRSDPAVISLFDKAISYYTTERGYEIIDITLPYLPQNQKAHALTILSEVRSNVTPAQIAKLTYPNQLLLNVVGSHATCQDFLAAQKLRGLLMGHLSWLWEKYPGMLVVTPTTPCAGWKVGHPGDVMRGGRGVSDGDMSLKSMEYVFVANWTGCPAISCPMGFAGECGDVPVGIMVCIEDGLCLVEDALLMRYRRWASGGVKRSYWLGGGRARACSGMKGSEDRSAKMDGSTYWIGRGRIVNNVSAFHCQPSFGTYLSDTLSASPRLHMRVAFVHYVLECRYCSTQYGVGALLLVVSSFIPSYASLAMCIPISVYSLSYEMECWHVMATVSVVVEISKILRGDW